MLDGIMKAFRCQRCDMPADICKGCVEKVEAEVASLKLQIHELQEIVKLCVDQGGLNFHDEGGKCPEDDTCDCPDAKRVNVAMEGFVEKPLCEHVFTDYQCEKCGKGQEMGKRIVSSDTCDHGKSSGLCLAVGCKNESDGRKFR